MKNETKNKMKTRQILGIFSLAALALTMSACSNDELLEGEAENKEKVELVPMTFTAGMAQTRTELVEQGIFKKVRWQQGDVISILNLGGEQQVNCPFTTQNNDFTATFTGEAPEADAYLAVYPRQNGKISGDYDGNSTQITLDGLELKSEQQAADGSFDRNAHLAAGYVSSKNGVPALELQNLCALVKFSVDGDQVKNVTKVVFSGQGNESLAAKSFSVRFPRQAVTNAGFSDLTESSESITLEAPEDGFKPQTDYYIAVLPNTLTNGFKLEFHLNGDEIIEKIASKEATLIASSILNLGKITVGELPDAKIENKDFIKAVEEAVTNIGWTVAEDGTVTLDENNLAKVEAVSYLTLTNKGLTDLSGIEYFTGLTTLYCDQNNLEKLDVSNLKKLVTLKCSSNTNLTELNVTGLTALKTLECSNCELTTLSLQGLESLRTLTCNGNKLTSLNLSGLNVSSITCYNNQLESLDLSGHTNLRSLSASNNKMTSLKLEGVTMLTTLNCTDNNLSDPLDVSKLADLTQLYCDNNELTTLSIVNNTKLTNLKCGNQKNNQTLTLTLTSDQKTKWDDTWSKNYQVENGRVTTNVSDETN